MNEQNNTNICPCCGKGCDLSAPRCGRGEEYLRTGVIPPRGEHHHKNHDKNHHYEELDRSEKIIVLLARMGHNVPGKRGGQKRILHLLREKGSMTQRDLTEQLGIQPGSASEIIKKMENAGYITRTTNEDDRRTANIILTEEGIAETQNCDLQNTDALAVLSDEEQAQLLTLLEKLAASWKTRECREGKHDHKPHHRHHHKDKH